MESASQQEQSLSSPCHTVDFATNITTGKFCLTRHKEICPKKEVTDDDAKNSEEETETIEVTQELEVTKEE